MKVKFIKDHPAGVKKGTETNVSKEIADKWAKEGYVEITEKEAKIERKTKELKTKRTTK
jgi:hypothetical protein